MKNQSCIVEKYRLQSIAMFQRGTTPPSVPPDPFTFELTSRYVSEPPWEIGNGLLDFLKSQVGVLGKVNISKYTVRYDAFDDGFQHCATKIRIYTMHFGYLVEFQRRSGSSLVFTSLFGAWVHEAPRSVVMEMPSTSHEEAILPLLDMLQSPCEKLKAEACAGLAALVHRGLSEESLLLVGGLRAVLNRLSAHPNVAISFPVNMLLERLERL